MNLRLIATDLDGTLLRSDRSISEHTRATLRRAADAGIEVVLVTARPPRTVDPVAAEIGGLGTAICSNGAIVYDLASRQMTAIHALPRDAAAEIVESLRAKLPNVSFAIETGVMAYYEPAYEGRPGQPPVSARLSTMEEVLVTATPIVKLLAWSEGHDVDLMQQIAVDACGHLATITHSGMVGLLEISALGVDKATTLATLCRSRGITSAEVIAFGDMPNDLPILRWAGTGYAMANGHPDLLASIPNLAPDNNSDGVAVVLDRLSGEANCLK